MDEFYDAFVSFWHIHLKAKSLLSMQHMHVPTSWLSIMICATSIVWSRMVKLVTERIHNGSDSLVREGGVFTPEGYLL